MSYNIAFVLASLLLIQLHAENLNSVAPCKTPAVADDDLNKKFRYGCFCGKNYPDINHSSQKSHRDLNTTERQELISLYEKIEPYDDIDQACQQHDICYIREGKQTKGCNDRISVTLQDIEEKFDASDDNLTHRQCKHLAFDIRSVFNTMFSPADDQDTIFDFGMLMVNGGITVANKAVQESADTISDNPPPHYPPAGERCLVESLHKIKIRSIEKVKIITIERGKDDHNQY